MSLKSVNEFIDYLTANPDMQRELDLLIRGENVDAAVAFASAHGFAFTSSEFRDVVSSVRQSQESPLSDAELEAVSGGSTIGSVAAGGAAGAASSTYTTNQQLTNQLSSAAQQEASRSAIVKKILSAY